MTALLAQSRESCIRRAREVDPYPSRVTPIAPYSVRSCQSTHSTGWASR